VGQVQLDGEDWFDEDDRLTTSEKALLEARLVAFAKDPDAGSTNDWEIEQPAQALVHSNSAFRTISSHSRHQLNTVGCGRSFDATLVSFFISPSLRLYRGRIAFAHIGNIHSWRRAIMPLSDL
jgi:hypothetical protein